MYPVQELLFSLSSIFDVVEVVPPHAIDRFCYLCDSRFHIEPVENLFSLGKLSYGLVMVMGEEASLYVTDEYSRTKRLARIKHRIPSNHCRGGQSQARIGRLRDEHIHRYITMVEEACRKQYTKEGVTMIKKLILIGPGQKKELVRDRCGDLGVDVILLNYLTIEETLEHFTTDILGEDQVADAKESIAEIQELLRLDPDRLAFGAEVRSAFDRGDLEKVWVKEEWKKNGKTKIIVLDHYFLDDFGGEIGLKWF